MFKKSNFNGYNLTVTARNKPNEKMKLIKTNDIEFDLIYKELEKNFIREERRDYYEARATLSDKSYTVYHIANNGERVGFITLWELSDFIFVEHFVIYEQYRSLGYGGLTLSLLRNEFESIVLEAEPPIDDIQKRRIAFYERNGFSINEVSYIQPSYHESGDEVPLMLMSYPSKLKDTEKVISEIYKTVYKKSYKGVLL